MDGLLICIIFALSGIWEKKLHCGVYSGFSVHSLYQMWYRHRGVNLWNYCVLSVTGGAMH